VAIVGGGFTGAAVAWRFADAGIRVAVLEAQRIGRGSTAASTALLMQEPDEDLTVLARRYTASRARRIWTVAAGATRDLVATLRRLQINCELRRAQSLYYACEERGAERLRAEYRRRRNADIHARWMDRPQLARFAQLDAAGGVLTSGNAQVDPYRTCVGLMTAAVNAGARVFERSRVANISTTQDGVTLATQHGVVRAGRVVIATGYATPYFNQLAARFRMLNTYVLATRPLSASERRHLPPANLMLWDTQRPYHYARWTPDHRLLLGGGDRPVVRDAARARAIRDATADLRSYFVGLYPVLETIDLEYAWEGLFAMPPDGLPFIGPHRRHPRHLFALGYGGNGMTLGFLAAQLLLDYHRGRPSPDLELFAFTRR
jgi:glycine/D-amino acid oxidase-like deaminating enzyme